MAWRFAGKAFEPTVGNAAKLVLCRLVHSHAEALSGMYVLSLKVTSACACRLRAQGQALSGLTLAIDMLGSHGTEGLQASRAVQALGSAPKKGNPAL